MDIEYKISSINQKIFETIVLYKINEYWETQLEITIENQDDYPDYSIGEFVIIPNRTILQQIESIFSMSLSVEEIENYIYNVASDYGTVIN